MQDLSEGIFINMTNLTLARRDSYLEYLRAGVKQDTLTALHTAPLHMQPLFPDQLLVKPKEEVSQSEERCSFGNSHRKPVIIISSLCFFNYQVISPAGPEVWCTGLEADQGQTAGQERSWQGLNFPTEAGQGLKTA